MSDAVAETVLQSLPVLFAGTSRYVVAVLGVATAGSVVVAEVVRRNISSATSSEYTNSFNKALVVAVTVVFSLATVALTLLDPGSVDTTVWICFTALAGASFMLPGTSTQLSELRSKRLLELYWLPTLFAAALFVIVVLSW